MNHKSRQPDLKVALGVAGVAQIVYLLTLAPTVTSEDSGELIAAAVLPGIAHPPGFPLWCALGKLFSSFPISSPAWRLNLMSSVLGATTVAVVFLIGRRLELGRAAVVTGALLLAFSRHF